MDHAPRVGVGHVWQTCSKIDEEPRPVLVGAPSRRQQRRQGAAPDQLHRDEQPAVGQTPQLVDRDDPGVLELAADLRLLDEPADHLGVVAVLLPDHLDGQVAAEVEVASLEDRAHPAPGELADELVARRTGPRCPGISRRSGPDQRSVIGRSREMTRGPPSPSDRVAEAASGPLVPMSRIRSCPVRDAARSTEGRPPGAAGTGGRAPPASSPAGGLRSRDRSRPRSSHPPHSRSHPTPKATSSSLGK